MNDGYREFRFGDSLVLVLRVSGELWFDMAYICRILDLPDTTETILKVRDDDWTVQSVHTSGLEMETRFVTEFGLFQLVLLSRSPKVRAFRKWLTTELFPAIYGGSGSSIDLESELNRLRIKSLVDAPKVAFADAVLDSGSPELLAEWAKVAGLAGKVGIAE